MNITDQNNWIKKLKHVDSNTPYLAVDVSKSINKIQTFKRDFEECEIFYAVKSFSDDRFLDEIKDNVSGFDVASWGECESILSLGVPPERILFSNPVKKPEHIQRAFESGVINYSFDSINELTKLAQIAPNSNVYIRVKVYDHGSAFPLSSKFGAMPVHIVPLISMAQELGLKPVGITFHVGSQSESVHAWEEAIEVCGSAMKRLEKVNIKLNFVNLGGGFPVEYTKKVLSIKEVISTIRAGVERHFPYKVKLISEPGRFISAEAGVMVATVIGRESRGSSEWIFTDVGTFNGLIEPLEMEGWTYPIFTPDRNMDNKLKKFTLTGPTCDPADTFALNVALPEDTEVGDRIFIGNAGAYTVVYSSSFNGFEMPELYYV